MALTRGARVGPYEITDLIGVGGMGEVYRSTDTNLKRAVAIKVLPDPVAADPERLARFQREAEVLASLNHPNIAAIYGLERTDTTTALAMELVEGPTLADRIAQGRVPVDDALPVARQIAEGLEAAHERGIVHRDLKPANIKLRPDGTVKILDFGLAKAFSADTARPSVMAMTNSPTITSPIGMTGVGVILGTAAYMSPEQAKGYVADHRSDIFAFGCVLYEMLAGRQAFEGDTVSDVFASIIAREPDFARLPANLHPRLVELLHRCLAKNPRRRWQAAGDVRIELESAAVPPTETVPLRPHPRAERALQLATLIATAGLAAGLAWWFKPAAQAGVTGVTSFEIQLPLGGVSRGVVASISHDGSKIAYIGNNRIWVRSLSTLTSTEVQGSEHASGLGSPVFSPDGRSIAFWGGGRNPGIKVVPVTGGAAAIVASAAPVTGMTWNGDYLLFGQTNITGNTNPRITQPGIYRVLARSGGQAELFVAAGRDEILAHPFLLPDGDTLLMTSASAARFDRWTQARIEAYSIKAADRRVVVDGGADARYLPTGHIVYALGGILFAARFDAVRRETKGSPVAVVEGVNRGMAFSEGISQFWVSDGGTLIYQPGPATTRTIISGIVMSERHGRMQALKLPESPYESPRISPDGLRVAYVIDDGQQAHIWTAPLSGATQPTKLTFEGRNRFPVWSPDGTRIAFQSNRDGRLAIYSQRAEPGRPEPLTTPDVNVEHVPESWTRAGDLLSYSAVGEQGASLWTISVGNRKATQIPNVVSQWPLNSSFSKDGRWLAYGTRPRLAGANIYVQSIPPRDGPYQLTDGLPAHHPMWSPEGTEVFFFSGTNPLLSIPVSTTPTFTWRAPVAVVGGFQPITTIVSGPNFDITPDAKRFVFIGYPNQDGGVDVRSDQQLNVVLNWFDVLKTAVN